MLFILSHLFDFQHFIFTKTYKAYLSLSQQYGFFTEMLLTHHLSDGCFFTYVDHILYSMYNLYCLLLCCSITFLTFYTFAKWIASVSISLLFTVLHEI